jgi:hypothetical protein
MYSADSLSLSWKGSTGGITNIVLGIPKHKSKLKLRVKNMMYVYLIYDLDSSAFFNTDQDLNSWNL